MNCFIFFRILVFTCILKLCYTFKNHSFTADNEVYILLVEITKMHNQYNGLSTIMLGGEFPDEVFRDLPPATTIVSFSTDSEDNKNNIAVDLPYPANAIIMVCKDTRHFEESLKKAMTSPYWYPLAKITIYIKYIRESEIHWLFYVLWFYRCSNAIIVQNSKIEKRFIVHRYDPYKMPLIDLKKDLFGCWTASPTAPIVNFRKAFYCDEGCYNITTKRRSDHLGTCLSYSSLNISLGNMEKLNEANLFEDRGKNYNGFVFRAHAVNLPFMKITKDENERVKMARRDGQIWNTISDKLNFTIELSDNTNLGRPLKFETAVLWIFDVSLRKIDLLLVPIFRMDLIFVNVDTTYPVRESGVCIIAHRAGIENIFSEAEILTDNLKGLTIFGTCFTGLWASIFIFYIADQRSVFHSIGSALTNTIRSFLSLGMYGTPTRFLHSFRILMTATNWGFFLINFSIQAAVISQLATFKRGKEVNTFEDVIEKGYPLFGIATPDVILPDTEDIYVNINSKLIHVQDMMACPADLANNTKMFCLSECSNARYMEASYLDGQGRKYMHVAEERIHNYYLNMIHHQHSPMTESFNKIVMALIEAGLIKKWEDYKFIDLVEDHQARPLGINDVQAVFRTFGYMICLSTVCFVLELCCWLLIVVKSKLLNLNARKNILIKG